MKKEVETVKQRKKDPSLKEKMYTFPKLGFKDFKYLCKKKKERKKEKQDFF